MNRRNFFGTVGAAIVGAVVGSRVATPANLEFVRSGGFTVDGVSGLRPWNNVHDLSIGTMKWSTLCVENDGTTRFHIVTDGNVSLNEPNPTAVLHVGASNELPDWYYGAWL